MAVLLQCHCLSLNACLSPPARPPLGTASHHNKAAHQVCLHVLQPLGGAHNNRPQMGRWVARGGWVWCGVWGPDHVTPHHPVWQHQLPFHPQHHLPGHSLPGEVGRPQVSWAHKSQSLPVHPGVILPPGWVMLERVMPRHAFHARPAMRERSPARYATCAAHTMLSRSALAFHHCLPRHHMSRGMFATRQRERRLSRGTQQRSREQRCHATRYAILTVHLEPRE